MLPNAKNTVCAFTQKARKFAKMMLKYQHTVYFYGHEDSEVKCTELISVLTKQDFIEAWGKEPDWNDVNYVNICLKNSDDKSKQIHNLYYKRCLDEMSKRMKKNDLICSFWGFPNELLPLKNSHGAICIEPGIGCTRTYADFCAYESYAILHQIRGLKNDICPMYGPVIPNYFDLDEFDLNKIDTSEYSNDLNKNGFDEIENKPKEYFLFLARIIYDKGINIILSIAEALPNINFVFVGPGTLNTQLKNVFVYPPVGAIGRAKWMSNAKGFLLPTLYLEPFGGSAVEAMICGTPAITSDWGVFNETVIHGYTGYRCRIIEHFIFAVKNIDKIDRNVTKKWACENYSLDAIYPLFKEWFNMIIRLHTDKDGKKLDYYALNDERSEMDWLKKSFPFPHTNIERDKSIDVNTIIPIKNEIHVVKKRIAIITQTEWAFGTIFKGLQKYIDKYSVDIFDWNKSYPKDNFLQYDIVLTTTWDTTKIIERNYLTKNSILFSGHGVVEFVNHTFDDTKNKKIISKKIISNDVDNFQLEDKLENYLRNRHFSVVSKQLYNLFTQKYNFKHISYTPCGVDLNIFNPLYSESKSLRVIHMNIKNNYSHGYDVKRIFLIKNIQNKILELGYDKDKIEFISPNDNEVIPCGKEMRNFYVKGDVWLCTSHSEGGPLGPIEAGACGLTVITTNVGDMPNFIDNNVNGFLVSEEDENKIVDEYVKHLIFLYENPEKLKEMKKNLYNKTKETRDWKIVSKNWEDFFDSFLKEDNKIYYDFIEIGTSDFDTEIQKCDDISVGLSIEPIKSYLEALPNKKNVKKINCAISDTIGEVKVYYITPENIEKHSLPNWIRGCNSINNYHPTVVKELENRKLSKDIVSCHIVSVINFETLVKDYNIMGCKYLKIDTEGHDIIILNNMLDCYDKNKNFDLPIQIIFESNILHKNSDVINIILRLQKYEYKVISSDENTLLELSNKYINYKIKDFL